MKIVKTFVFEGIDYQTAICKRCKEEFDSPTLTKRTKCRECRLKLDGPMRPYKKRK